MPTKTRRYADSDVADLRKQILDVIGTISDMRQLQKIVSLIGSDDFANGNGDDDDAQMMDDTDGLVAGAAGSNDSSADGTISGAGSTPFGSKTTANRYGERRTYRTLNLHKFSEEQNRKLEAEYRRIDALSERDLRLTGEEDRQTLKEIARLAVVEGHL
jgi:hypothetical protein